MSIAQAIRGSGIRPTNQTIADLALSLDQEKRALLKRIAEIDSEIVALSAQVQ